MLSLLVAVLLPAALVVANIMGAAMIAPQILRVRRHGTVEGMSFGWVGVGVAMNLWWTAYALATHQWVIMPVSIASEVLYLVLAAEAHRLVGRALWRPLLAGTATFGSIPVVPLAVGGWGAAGLAIGLCYGLQFAPATARSLLTRDLAGVSGATWAMAALEAAIWTVYGATATDPALLVGGTLGMIMATTIVIRWGRWRVASTVPLPS
ncbi:MAG: hypothetical protein ACK5PP_02410 [Acidimicrobiales bacterium]